MRTITLNDLQEAQAKLRAEIEGGNNPPLARMKYTDKEGRHCAIGHYFRVLEIPVPKMYSPINEQSIGAIKTREYLRKRGIEIDRQAESKLDRLQYSNDYESMEVLSDAVVLPLI